MKTIVTLILCALAFAHSNAQIVYTDVNPDTTIDGSYNLDLNNDGTADFILQVSATRLTCGHGQIIAKIKENYYPIERKQCSDK
jgi:hypothetical protein